MFRQVGFIYWNRKSIMPTYVAQMISENLFINKIVEFYCWIVFLARMRSQMTNLLLFLMEWYRDVIECRLQELFSTRQRPMVTRCISIPQKTSIWEITLLVWLNKHKTILEDFSGIVFCWGVSISCLAWLSWWKLYNSCNKKYYSRKEDYLWPMNTRATFIWQRQF